LLVDANLAAPQIGALFGLERRKGLRDFLIDDVPLKDLIVNPGIEHLVVLPAGAAVSNSAELLATDASTRLFQELQSRYSQRYIIFDAPSVLTADGLSLFEKVDAVLVVAERNRTTRAELEQCALALKPFNLIGSVLCEAIPEVTPASAAFGSSRSGALQARQNP
jgi:MinD-like ATPase involved in chromosome partitioning or flagellar assembly